MKKWIINVKYFDENKNECLKKNDCLNGEIFNEKKGKYEKKKRLSNVL